MFRQQEEIILSPRKWKKLEAGHLKKVRGIVDKTLIALGNGFEKGKTLKTWSMVLALSLHLG